MLDSLEVKGFISKDRDGKNWKQKNVKLTKSGSVTLKELKRISANLNHEIERVVSVSEVEVLTQILNKLEKL